MIPQFLREVPQDQSDLSDIIADGLHQFGQVGDPDAAAHLLGAVRADRRFDGSLFLSEAEFDANPQYENVTPCPGRNLLERHQDKLGFIESNPAIVGYLSTLLGADYKILDKKLVAGLPHSVIPDWVAKRIAGNAGNDLGAFVRPEYRDVTYFCDIDFHQEISEGKDRTSDFITLQVHLHDMGPADAPLHVIPGSHRLGVTTFPHKLEGRGGVVTYGDDHGRTLELRQHMLVGPAGSAYLWHALVLHGTRPGRADHERISLRYMIARDDLPMGATGIDAVNAAIDGPLSPNETRIDRAPRIQANALK